MTSTTPTYESSHRRTRSKSPRSRPTTPLRPSSRSSLRDSASRARGPHGAEASPLESLEAPFAELSDAMADLESNFMQLQLMHESLARFSESFAGFLYGLNMNAFCVDFPETPIPESFRRPQNNPTNPDLSSLNRHRNSQGYEADVEATFLTTDTSFVDNPPSSKASKFSTPASGPAPKSSGIPAQRRGGIPRAGGRGGGIPVRGGAARGARGGSGIGRGGATTTGRGRALR
ncbi:hypothetical protein K505DRAFT_412682 [Melanomma pulvis-pyrius CBS 109.77]|uniref:DASH complex subunit DAM1 n=1 Tax=Melanomma pulvis-pyrius CBS 109.77 TaxID=1314802 RepID=A0A6A6XW44_9PLEO|nr:hypothetical protein K505DRAFT_412682 [Melanomma pulvis-pyrius CBS 109.77]